MLFTFCCYLCPLSSVPCKGKEAKRERDSITPRTGLGCNLRGIQELGVVNVLASFKRMHRGFLKDADSS